ncbi:hypothetical protein ACL02T_11935 [Pseudonocardia sp. RS010]|uniref:hypothetical protein n=1 Tax=Pseudonocardia sp. RS010 TaxID=3385979 RepID=UPI0039A0F341
MKDRRDWEQAGAAIGILASLLLALGIGMGVSANVQSPAPNVANAQSAPLFIALGLSQLRLAVLFTSLGLALFLWFLGALWVRLREGEGESARGSMVAVVGATVGSALILGGLVVLSATALSASALQANAVPALYVVSALSVAVGGGVFSIFFFGVATVILHTGAMGRWLGWLAVLVGVLCALAFTAPFFDSGLLDAASGVLGRYAWFIGLVVWVLLASVVLTRDQRRRIRQGATPSGTTPSEREAVPPPVEHEKDVAAASYSTDAGLAGSEGRA